MDAIVNSWVVRIQVRLMIPYRPSLTLSYRQCRHCKDDTTTSSKYCSGYDCQSADSKFASHFGSHCWHTLSAPNFSRPSSDLSRASYDIRSSSWTNDTKSRTTTRGQSQSICLVKASAAKSNSFWCECHLWICRRHWSWRPKSWYIFSNSLVDLNSFLCGF